MNLTFIFKGWFCVPRPDILNLISGMRQKGSLQFNLEQEEGYTVSEVLN